MEFSFTSGGKEYQIKIDDRGERGVRVAVNGKEFCFGADDAVETVSVAQAAMPKRLLGAKEVAAPLAGTISEIAVGAGDIVSAGQKLLTLSAMKMENEILSEIDGKIKEIKIAQGQKVAEGDILIILV
jgi:biotin carboxyl carrier protein